MQTLVALVYRSFSVPLPVKEQFTYTTTFI
jgi:hypothetical protein